MISQAPLKMAQQAYPAPAGRHHLLIITDCPVRLRSLRASISTGGIEITGAASSEELSRACQSEYDLAVIDVAAWSLPEVLRILRSSVRHSGIALLVEASRVLTEPGLTGVLPWYRAMPCSRSDLVKLAHYLMLDDVHPVSQRTLL